MPECNFERDCTMLPWPENCFYFCMERILRKANPDQKRSILGIRPDTAASIFNAYQRHRIDSFEDLAKYLTEMQIQEIVAVFRNITQEQLNYFL